MGTGTGTGTTNCSSLIQFHSADTLYARFDSTSPHFYFLVEWRMVWRIRFFLQFVNWFRVDEDAPSHQRNKIVSVTFALISWRFNIPKEYKFVCIYCITLTEIGPVKQTGNELALGIFRSAVTKQSETKPTKISTALADWRTHNFGFPTATCRSFKSFQRTRFGCGSFI